MPYALAPHPSPGWREPQPCRTIHEDQPPYDMRMAGAVSARRMGSAEGQTAFWKTAQTGCARHAMDLQHGNAEEPVATEVRLRAVDARHGGKADQGQVWCRVECQFSWSTAGATRHHLPEALAPRAGTRRGFGRAMAQEGITRGSKPWHIAKRPRSSLAMPPIMRSDHHSGRTWGKKGETPVVKTTGACHRMSLISAITSRGHMRFMNKEKGGVNAAVFIEFLKRMIVGAKRAIFLIVDRGPAHIAKKTRAFV